MYAEIFGTFAARPAVRDDRGELTYADWASASRRLASALRGPGAAVAIVVIVGNNSVDWATVDRAIAIGSLLGYPC